MASYSIQTRTIANGEKRYKATITVKNNGRIVHRFAKTHKKKAIATSRAKNQVSEIETKGFNTQRATNIAELLDLFMGERDLWDNTGRTKQYVIKMLRDCDIANVKTNRLTTADIIKHCKNRKGAGAKPATIYHDIAYITHNQRRTTIQTRYDKGTKWLLYHIFKRQLKFRYTF